jgi:hypothetical protein
MVSFSMLSMGRLFTNPISGRDCHGALNENPNALTFSKYPDNYKELCEARKTLKEEAEVKNPRAMKSPGKC